jgi:Domain of unknown function (DUF4062)
LPSTSKLDVFISSSINEFEKTRILLANRINKMSFLEAVLLERRGADTENVLTVSLKGVERCDIYVGIFGAKYSEITIKEYRTAVEVGKDRLIYVAKTAQREPRLAEFIKKELSDQSKYHQFENDPTLLKQVRKDLNSLVVKKFQSDSKMGAVHSTTIPIGATDRLVDIRFKDEFSEKLSMVMQMLAGGPHEKTNDAIDVVIMMFKERIDKWDVPSIKFATEELFKRLYKFSEKDGMSDLYLIFKDLFARAYAERRHLLDAMLETFGLIMFESWVPLDDVEIGEKAAKVMLKLAIDFLDKDLEVVRDCSMTIDDLAGDFFEPEILSKEILLAARAFEMSVKDQRLHEFTENLSDWIKVNDQYAWDADIKTYLRDSIDYAQWEHKNYSINLDQFKIKVLYPELQQTIDKQIEGYVDFLLESESHEDTSFEGEELVKTIRAYEFLRPEIAKEIQARILSTGDHPLQDKFDRIIHSSKLLGAVYGKSQMVTTFDELVRFLEANSDTENLGIGLTTFGLAMINFTRKPSDIEKESLNQIARKYGVEDLELGTQKFTFEMDHLVYLSEGQYDMTKLTSFLKEVHAIIEIESFSSDVEFRLRRFRRT